MVEAASLTRKHYRWFESSPDYQQVSRGWYIDCALPCRGRERDLISLPRSKSFVNLRVGVCQHYRWCLSTLSVLIVNIGCLTRKVFTGLRECWECSSRLHRENSAGFESPEVHQVCTKPDNRCRVSGRGKSGHHRAGYRLTA